jgi:hypothetical protein
MQFRINIVMNALQTLTILMGLVITGEAIALLIGVHVINSSNNRWVSVKNDAYLALDILIELGLIFDGIMNSI